MLINVLGNCSEIDKIKQFARKKIYLVEDNLNLWGPSIKGKI